MNEQNRAREREIRDRLSVDEIAALPLWDGSLGVPPDDGVVLGEGVKIDNEGAIVAYVELVEDGAGALYRLTDWQPVRHGVEAPPSVPRPSLSKYLARAFRFLFPAVNPL